MTDLLQRHMSAGRLDMAEYERRVEHATAAVYEQDLAGLLDDLPPLDEDGEPVGPRDREGRSPGRDAPGWEQPSWWPPRPTGRSRPGWGRGVPFPLIALGAVALVIATHGWILFPLVFFLFAMRGGGCGPRHRGRHGGRAHRDHWEAHRDHAPTGGGDGSPQWPGRFDPFDDEQRM